MSKANSNGNAAEAAFEAFWRRRGHLERLPDKKDLMGLNKGMRLADFSKPSDYLVSSPTEPLHYAEVKHCEHSSRFSFSKIRPKQSEAALREAKRGCKAYRFYIFSSALGQWFIMSCVDYADAVSAGLRSLPYEELEKWNPHQ